MVAGGRDEPVVGWLVVEDLSRKHRTNINALSVPATVAELIANGVVGDVCVNVCNDRGERC